MIISANDTTMKDAVHFAISLVHLERDMLAAAWGHDHPSVKTVETHLHKLEKLVDQPDAERIKSRLEWTGKTQRRATDG